MSDLTGQKVEQSILDRQELHDKFLDNVKTYSASLELEKIAFQYGILEKKIKELMGLSIAIVTHCEPSMQWHLEQALLAGAKDEEVYETIDVAIGMGGSPAAAYARSVLEAFELFKEKHKL
jgi:AhpD family alkylhydroperoxidase